MRRSNVSPRIAHESNTYAPPVVAARVVVFVEVKTRTSDQFGGVAAAVTPDKVRRLRRLAGLWLAGQGGSWAAVRIDVIGVRIGRRPAPEITHLQGVG